MEEINQPKPTYKLVRVQTPYHVKLARLCAIEKRSRLAELHFLIEARLDELEPRETSQKEA